MLVSAFAPAALAGRHVAVIDLNEAVRATSDAQAAQQHILDQFQQSVRNLERDTEDTPEVRRQRERLHDQIEAAQKVAIQELGKKMMPVVEKYAKRKHYEAVLVIGDQNSTVAWFEKGNDITKEIVAEYEKTYSQRASRK